MIHAPELLSATARAWNAPLDMDFLESCRLEGQYGHDIKHSSSVTCGWQYLHTQSQMSVTYERTL